MSNIVWPDSLAPRTFSLELNVDRRVGAAVLGGSDSIVDMLDDYWTATLEIDSRSGELSAKLEAYVNYLQGGIHTASFGHIVRKLPRGTRQTDTTLTDDSSKGASYITIACSVGDTLLAGDMLGVSGLLLQCSDDTVATTTSMVVPLVNRLRTSLTSGSVVTLTHPKVYFRLSTYSGLGFGVGYSDSITLSFEEKI